MGEGATDLADNPYDTVSHGLGRPSLPSEIVDKLDNRFPFMLTDWERQQTMHTRRNLCHSPSWPTIYKRTDPGPPNWGQQMKPFMVYIMDLVAQLHFSSAMDHQWI